jgi:hypothetical protein
MTCLHELSVCSLILVQSSARYPMSDIYAHCLCLPLTEPVTSSRLTKLTRSNVRQLRQSPLTTDSVNQTTNSNNNSLPQINSTTSYFANSTIPSNADQVNFTTVPTLSPGENETSTLTSSTVLSTTTSKPSESTAAQV